jgi:short-subunit dehydrogenase
MSNQGVAVVTGASAGIGAEYARRLAERGHDVVLVARRRERLDRLAEELRAGHGVRVEVLVADLGHPEGVTAVADRARRDDVALLINNAGINGYGPFAEVEPAVLAHVLAVNVTAPTLLARAALPGMLERGAGAIVNVASLLAFAGALPPDPLPWRATYAGTKGYLVTFSRTLASELAGTPVRVQALCPGLTATEFHLTSGTDPVQGTAPDEQPRAMAAADVVRASLLALEAGEVVCAPGLDDPRSIDRLVEAEAEIRTASRREPARRYAAGA